MNALPATKPSKPSTRQGPQGEDPWSGEWILVTYTVPEEPSRVRVAVWRALKKIGAVSVQRSIYVLPTQGNNYKSLQQVLLENKVPFQTFFARPTDPALRRSILDKARTERAAEYEEIREKTEDFLRDLAKEVRTGNFTLEEVEENEADYRKLERWLEETRNRDWGLSVADYDKTRKTLERAREKMEEFGHRVHDALNE